MKLLKYAELGAAKRNEPCEEYPGTWYVFLDGTEVGKFRDAPTDPPGSKGARDLACEFAKKMSEVGTTTVCWDCDDNDPRVGQVWFTGFYQYTKYGWEGEG